MNTEIDEKVDVTTLPELPKIYEKPYSLWNKEKGYIWLGNRKQGTYCILKPHKKGLLLIECVNSEVRTGDKKGKKYQKTKKIIIPGNYSRKEVINFILTKASIPTSAAGKWAPFRSKNGKRVPGICKRTFIKRLNSAFRESGYWKNRGKIEWKDCPKEFWKWCPLDEFVKGRTHSYKSWWKHISYKLDGHKFPKISHLQDWREPQEERVVSEYPDTYRKFVPVIEKPNCLKAWNTIKFWDLSSILKVSGDMKHWNIFITNVYPYFWECIKGHSRASLDFTPWLSQCSKHPKFVETLDRTINNGIDIRTLSSLTNPPKTLEQINRCYEYSVIYKQVKQKTRRNITPDYKPPEIELPEGWAWADSKTFYELSDMYSCCISNAGYDRGVRDGTACVAYRLDRKDRGGAVAYITHTGRYADPAPLWRGSQIKGFANKEPHNDFKVQSRQILDELNKKYKTKFDALQTLPVIPEIDIERLNPLQLELHTLMMSHDFRGF